MTTHSIRPGLWRREFVATRTSAHIAFAVFIWPMLTVMGATVGLMDLPYFSVSLVDALMASLAGTLMIVPDMLVVGAVFFGLSGFIFSRLGIRPQGRRFDVLRLCAEPLLMVVAVAAGVSLWYPAVLGQALFLPLRAIPAAGVVSLLIGAVVLGAHFAGREGKGARLVAVLIGVGVLSPVPLVIRSALEPFAGHLADVVILGVDSVSYGDDQAPLDAWVKRRGGAWYERAVAPGLLTNPVWTSILTMQPVRTHGVFHAFQHFPPGVPAFLSAARANGYRTVSVFPDQLTCAVGSRAGFDDDRSGPVGWRQLLLPTVVDSSLLVPVLKPALPRVWPSFVPWNQAGTFTYDIRREIRGILRAGSPKQRTLVAAHTTYTHLPAYPSTRELSWAELRTIAKAPAGAIRDRSFDWQDVDESTDPLKLHPWKLRHVYSVIASEVDAAGYLENGGRLVVFSDHGDRAGLRMETFSSERYFHVPLATFGLPARCPREPISLIEIGSLIGLSNVRAAPAVEFTMAPQALWASLVKTAHLRWSGDVDLDAGLLAGIFKGLQRHDPWPDVNNGHCTAAGTGR